jgi:hypothetical protein
MKIYFNLSFGSSHSARFAYQTARQSPYGFIWPLGAPIGCKEVL